MKQQNLHKLAAMKTNVMGAVAATLLLIGSLLIVQADDKRKAKDPLTEKYAAKEKEIGAALKSGLISKEIAERILEEYERQLKSDQRRFQFGNRQAGVAVADARARWEEIREQKRKEDEARKDERRNRDEARRAEMLKNKGQAAGAGARARGGDSISTSSDGKGGRYTLMVRDGKKRFKAKGDGAVLFDGPVDTEEQRKKLNADLLKKLEQLEGQRVGNRAAAFRGRWEEMRKNRGQAGDLFARQRLGGFNRRDPFRDLDLTEEQKKEIAAIKQKQSEEQLEYSEMMKELEKGYLKRMEGILTDEQRKKYRETQAQRGR